MKKYLLSLLFITTLAGCNYSLVPQKSAQINSTIVDVGNDTEDLYDAVIVSPDKSFSPYENRYNSIDAKIDSITNADMLRPHSKNLVTQDNIIKKFFEKYKSDHRARNLNNAELTIYKLQMRRVIKPRLVSESSFK